MESSILAKDSFAALKVELRPGEAVKAEPGAMLAYSNVTMTTGMPHRRRDGGGILPGWLRRLMSGVGRMIASESFFVNAFRAESGAGYVMLAPAAPGEIKDLRLEPNTEVYLQGGAFLACSEQVEVDPSYQGLRGLFTREGLFFLKVTPGRTAGHVFFHTYGAIVEVDIHEGEPLTVDNGYLVAFSEGVRYSLRWVTGLKPLILGGEGLVLRFEGEGKVWLQTRELPSFAGLLAPLLPTQKSG